MPLDHITHFTKATAVKLSTGAMWVWQSRLIAEDCFEKNGSEGLLSKEQIPILTPEAAAPG